eukprot:CAMPEP_0118670056 /NCGR_PEP_ID=MMETSP0785-20121206/21236_1 /TAXON_ID=91992 /ORGANISM="Bolidomonas pacifica, Strain CCMP 1866" /LENGTH=44 /DNA_ID= /DNA_START= /DNA_END= /DNA_ORIENTATION=
MQKLAGPRMDQTGNLGRGEQEAGDFVATEEVPPAVAPSSSLNDG